MLSQLSKSVARSPVKDSYDVIIAGAGPVGLFLASELALTRSSVLVLERDASPVSPWKSMPFGRRGLNMQANEAFYRRGPLKDLIESEDQIAMFQKTDHFVFAGHFAGLGLNANRLDLDRFKYVLPNPALLPRPSTLERIETRLAEHAESLGVTILRGKGFAGIAHEDDGSVTVAAGEDKQTFIGKWLVGCDGGRSAVRKAMGVKLAGTEPQFTGYIVQCELEDPTHLLPDMHITNHGLYINDPDVMYIADFDDGAFDRSQELTKEHIQQVLRRVSGVADLKLTKLNLASSFTDRCMQAETYRKGRVLLAGDAAHIHSPLGAQGLNLGIADALNLGWKLSATVQREKQSSGNISSLDLLDTYETERRPIGAKILDWSRAQVTALRPSPHGAATYALFRELLNTSEGTSVFIDRLWGLSQRYSPGSEATFHEAVGRSAPDFEFADGSRLGQKLAAGKGLLIDFGKEPTESLKELRDRSHLQDLVEYHALDAKQTCGLKALLVRPDGIVAWAADEKGEVDLESLKAAFGKWFPQ